MYKYTLSFSNYKLRDYEFHLAENEIKGLFSEVELKRHNDFIEFNSEIVLDVEKLKNLTFFSSIEIENCKTPKTLIIPKQVLIENKRKIHDLELFEESIKNTTREIRYLTHSFHEYKGRFYPQLAKSLINYAGVSAGDVLLDPFCGSGTMLVESLLYGLNAFGIDINPVAYLIAKAKTRSFYIEIDKFGEIKQKYKTITSEFGSFDITILKKDLDLEYLKKWFPEENLEKLLFLLNHINIEENEDIKLLLKVTLSNILRGCSFQDPSELRIRRRESEPKKNIFEIFLKDLSDNIEALQNFALLKINHSNLNIQNYLGSAKDLKNIIGLSDDSIDLVITSPPYATALPYIDTDRLSLFAFGFAKTKEKFRQIEKDTIGNREITPKERDNIEIQMIDSFNTNILPKEILLMIEKIYLLNKKADVGFRKKNTASLLFKYFIDMKIAMQQVYDVLKKDKYLFMVVGNNRTTADTELIYIPTDDFIALICQQIGFYFEKKINLEVQRSYTIYSKNAINTESILIFRKH